MKKYAFNWQFEFALYMRVGRYHGSLKENQQCPWVCVKKKKV